MRNYLIITISYDISLISLLSQKPLPPPPQTGDLLHRPPLPTTGHSSRRPTSRCVFLPSPLPKRTPISRPPLPTVGLPPQNPNPHLQSPIPTLLYLLHPLHRRRIPLRPPSTTLLFLLLHSRPFYPALPSFRSPSSNCLPLSSNWSLLPSYRSSLTIGLSSGDLPDLLANPNFRIFSLKKKEKKRKEDDAFLSSKW